MSTKARRRELVQRARRIMLLKTSRAHCLEWIHMGTITKSLKGRLRKNCVAWLSIVQSIDGFEFKTMQNQLYFRRC